MKNETKVKYSNSPPQIIATVFSGPTRASFTFTVPFKSFIILNEENDNKTVQKFH